MYMPYPFQIVQSSTKIEMAYTFTNAPAPSTWIKSKARLTTLDGPFDRRWEGDTLGRRRDQFNDKTWFDRAGNFHSDALACR
jgi:hypothetical protein